jgi:ABC-type glutathione transport system ATPase component
MEVRHPSIRRSRHGSWSDSDEPTAAEQVAVPVGSGPDGPGPEAALVVEHLTKRLGDRVAFDDVSIEVGYGEVFGFLGPNGAGQTTTGRTRGTPIAPTSGSATAGSTRRYALTRVPLFSVSRKDANVSNQNL